ncbi:flagellar basal-body rod protein FlgG [Clostridium saccharobutylicum]|uniref:flagellar hook-basal body complex protein n=1 Tax=Clostridium saccharobutylicum TaxID=169679 RepID=UPI00098391BA|nr:flagellar hook-basal body complex protein [Clostridium saccharobutylicum]AQS11676.1 flagellar basal-body rod protein FlgG [Clostridium saccharobutylicum]MBC2434968.1 flagellar hook-basal body complex protein [Clostridium saccharobutylicum]NSB86777.1 flagellar hook protein FlgE [Clostridium saccharobutylicum]NYC30325.1 flagellar hook protein FlgE [Clostridium saccharobutylicum]OOM12595.1 flagellar basal-body rod protein FlgG [Clostridium saccharobutylicum]
MLRCMYSGISGMKVNQTKLDVIGNNIANVGTTGFKSSRAEFTDMLYQNSAEATAPTATKGGTNAKQIGLGAKLSSINKVMGQGNALSTGRTLDVCVDGDGYLVVGKGAVTGLINVGTDSAGNTSGITSGTMEDTLYTRDGNLTLDKDGNLLTADGYRVMGYYATNALKINSKGALDATYVDADTAKFDNAKLQPLAIPDSVMNGSTKDPIKKFEIGKDGVITAVLGSGSRTAIGQVALASFKNPEGLTGIGGNLLQVSSNSGSPIIKSAKGVTTNSNSSGFGDLVQGALEGSNVDLTEQFTDMITASRSFQASSKMVTTGDEILQTITGLIR